MSSGTEADYELVLTPPARRVVAGHHIDVLGVEVGVGTAGPGGRPLIGSAPAGNISFRFPPDLRDQLRARAQAEHVAEAEVIRRAVHDYLERSRAS